MTTLKTILRRSLLSLGVLTLVVIVGFWITRYVVWSGNVDDFYAMELDDGPHIFWIDDENIRVVRAEYEEPGEDPSSIGGILSAAWRQELPAAYRVHEHHIDLNDRILAREQLDDLGIVGFDPWRSITIEPSSFTAERVAAVSDIHGCYKHLVRLLQNSGVVDEHLDWAWGTGHFVIAGDLVDKGPGVTDLLWLIKKLEMQAEESGGKVHYLLGNHEMMVLRGGIEPQHRGYKNRTLARELAIGYGDLFDETSELGRWMRTRNTAIKLNERLFVHAGISELLVDSGLTLDDINRYGRRLASMKNWYAADPGERSILRLIESYWGPYDYRGYTGIRGEIGKIATAFSDKVDDLASHKRVPEIMGKIFGFYGVHQAVVGHSHMKDISLLRDGRIVGIDIRMPKNDELTEESNAQMLLIEGDALYRVTMDGEKIPLEQ